MNCPGARLCFLGYVTLRLGFHPAPIPLGFVLGPRFEETFRRAMTVSRGDLAVFVERPISAVLIALSVLLVAVQIFVRLRPRENGTALAVLEGPSSSLVSRRPKHLASVTRRRMSHQPTEE